MTLSFLLFHSINSLIAYLQFSSPRQVHTSQDPSHWGLMTKPVVTDMLTLTFLWNLCPVDARATNHQSYLHQEK